MKPRLHLFIIWERSLGKKDIILEDLKNEYTIREVFEIKWKAAEFMKNLKRFYGNKLPNASLKAKECGKGSFLLVLISDNNPKLEKTALDDINQVEINSSAFNSKQKYRKWVGGGFQIHASNSDEETKHDLTLLFGKKIEVIENDLPKKWDGVIKKMGEQNLTGHDGWKNMTQFFDVLNSTTNYIVLRSFEELPEKILHKDLDILTDDVKSMSIIINGEGNSVDLPIIIDGKKVSIDFRYQMGHHYEEKWSKEILKKRILFKNSFYVPCKEDYFYLLFFHNMRTNSKKYNEKLEQLATEIGIKENIVEILSNNLKSKKFMAKYMKKMGYNETNFISRLIYKIKNNEMMRLVNASIFLVKTYGIVFFLKKVKLKIKNTL